jgi:hypothetical protein
MVIVWVLLSITATTFAKVGLAMKRSAMAAINTLYIFNFPSNSPVILTGQRRGAKIGWLLGAGR